MLTATKDVAFMIFFRAKAVRKVFVSNKRLVLTRRSCESEAISHSCRFDRAERSYKSTFDNRLLLGYI